MIRTRLIDADKIDFNEVFVGASKFAEDTRQAGKMLIDAQPTAYDVDKVVEELERLKETEQNREDECDEEGNGDAEQIFSDGESQGKFKAYIKAIKVVKAGGIDGR